MEKTNLKEAVTGKSAKGTLFWSIHIILSGVSFGLLSIALIKVPVEWWIFFAPLVVGSAAYMSYHLTALVFAKQPTRSNYETALADAAETPAVAILMVVCDDFDPKSAESLIRQSYGEAVLYICDDSSPSHRPAVDQFATLHPRSKVLRRLSRRGFKGGNLNHALSQTCEPLLVIVDSDELCDHDFIAELLTEYLRVRPAFLQAGHSARPGETRFQESLEGTLEAYWKTYELPRNERGCPLFLGHGAIMARATLERAGGFSEDHTSEDIDLSLRLASHRPSLLGAVSTRCWAREHIPPDIQSYVGRYSRWLLQDVCLAPARLPGVFGDNDLSFWQRVDLVLKQLHIPVSGFTAIYYVPIAVFLALRNPQHRVGVYSAWAGLIMAALSFAPAFPIVRFGPNKLACRLRQFSASIYLFLTLSITAACAVFSMAFGRQLNWEPTNCFRGFRAEPELRLNGGIFAYLRNGIGPAIILAILGIACGSLLFFALSVAVARLAVSRRASELLRGVATGLACVAVAQTYWTPEYVLVFLPLATLRY